MASVEQCWSAWVIAISNAMTAANLKPAAVAVDWPNLDILQAVATGQIAPVISVFDRGGARNKTKNMILNPALPYNFGTPGGVLTASADAVGDGQIVHLTGSGTVLVNDAFFVAFTQWSDQFFAEYIAGASDTLHTSLVGLTSAINAISGGSQFSASLTGSIISVTNLSGQNLPVRAAVLNIGSYTQEIYRWDRDIQITLWTNNPNDRQAYGLVIENLICGLEASYGLQLADQSWCRVLVKDDYVCKDLQLQDVFRRDFVCSSDYPVLQILPAWEIAALDYIQQNNY